MNVHMHASVNGTEPHAHARLFIRLATLVALCVIAMLCMLFVASKTALAAEDSEISNAETSTLADDLTPTATSTPTDALSDSISPADPVIPDVEVTTDTSVSDATPTDIPVTGNENANTQVTDDSANATTNSNTQVPDDLTTASTGSPTVSYSAHVESQGWQQSPSTDGETAGTTGQSKRLEAVTISLSDTDREGSITYNAHVENIGWQHDTTSTSGWTQAGQLAGTTGQSLRLEALQIALTGDLADTYDVYYRVHVESIGWMDWRYDGEIAGTTGLSLRIEALQIQLYEKGNLPAKVAKDTAHCYGFGHVQDIGWQPVVTDGTIIGTTGQSKRLEAIELFVDSPIVAEGSLASNTYVENTGWQHDTTSTSGWTQAGQLAGTTGQSLRLEALQIALTGDLAHAYDIYYRVHVSNIGWMSWASNGAKAGTSNYGARVEACQIYILGKGATRPEVPSDDSHTFFEDVNLQGSGYLQGTGQLDTVNAGEFLGSTSKPLEGISLWLTHTGGTEQLSGSLAYSVYESENGWTDWISDGNYAGTQDGSQTTQAIRIKLGGDVADYYDIYYRSHVQGLGSLGMAENGGIAGTTGCSLFLEGVWVYIVPKGQVPAASAPHAFPSVSNTSNVNLNVPCYN